MQLRILARQAKVCNWQRWLHAASARGAIQLRVGAQSELVVYTEAGHGFHADFRPENYRKADAEAGWRRMLDCFRKYRV